VQQTTSGSTELAASAEQMSKMSRDLLASMDRFMLEQAERSNAVNDKAAAKTSARQAAAGKQN